jgi:hypothetical protein
MEISDLFAGMQDVERDVQDALEPALAGCAEFSEIIQAMLTLALELQRLVASCTFLQIAFTPPEGPADVDLSPEEEERRPGSSVTEFINTLLPVTIHSLAQYYGDSVIQGSTMINARNQEMLQTLSGQSKMVERNIHTALIPAFTTLGSAIFPQGIGQSPLSLLPPIQPAIQRMEEALRAPQLVGEGGIKTTFDLTTSYDTTITTLTRMQEFLQQTLNEGYAPSPIPIAGRGDVHERQAPLITAASSLVTLQKIFNPLFEISADRPGAQKDSPGMMMRGAQAPPFTTPDIQPQTLIEPMEKGEPARENRIEHILRPPFEIAAFTPRLSGHIAPVRSKGMFHPSETERSEAELSQAARPTQGLPVVVQAFSSSATAARTVINELTRSIIPLIETNGGVVSPELLFNGTTFIPGASPLFEGKNALLSEILTPEKMGVTTTESTKPTTIFPQFPLLNLAATIPSLHQILPSVGGITGTSLSPATGSSQFILPTTVTTINEAFSVLENIQLLTAQPGKVPLTVQPASLPSPAGTLAQNIMFPHSGGMTATSSPKNEVTIHNTFNIEIAMRGQADERELRELGQKMGTILSEELKRYGGLTWR